ncbi:hypothetical protein BOTBODRAFT_38802 [Botryobasidium botryosum FD-172 SS1]|uniref:Cytochrome P450 n=1 Tax=Botryobasidium botryosum (strain FD-172 SS1) TaxID=930990 RepID=A0A067M7E6_BOTB1|nr:hypothetical protein BOTBODRAFT_38802 [Botryobasidium botryosum FD-172 SS1]
MLLDVNWCAAMSVLGSIFSVLYGAVLYLRRQEVLKSIDHLHGLHVILDPFSLFGQLVQIFPLVIHITVPNMYFWEHKYTTYRKFGWDIYAQTFLLPAKKVVYQIVDADAIKEMIHDKATFPKKEFFLLALYGPNVVTSGDEEAKRHRRIVAPSFSDRNNKLVWQETARIVEEMFVHWGQKETISVKHVVDITLPLALHVISAAGFGLPISWQSETESGVRDDVPSGHMMSYREAIETVCKNLYVKLLAPSWVLGLTKNWRHARLAFDELELYMTEMIESRRAEGDTLRVDEKGELYKSDVFSNLLAASDAEVTSGKGALSERELKGNIFIFLVAGHETTAHVLAFALGLLACYPDEQQKLYNHIKSVLVEDRLPVYEEMNTLTRPLAVFYEASRLYPPANSFGKFCVRDTTLAVHGADENEQRKPILIAKDSYIMIDAVGLHHNPRYWKDPEEFNPDRFMNGDWNRDALLTFSAGMRACLGRRFAETEAVAALTMIILRYKVELNPEFFKVIPGEAPRATRERLLKVKQALTLAPANLPLIFRKRE